MPFIASAHPGRTDENGGHTNHSDGSYHYHHGYPAHFHSNGVCMYDFDNQTNYGGSYNYSENSTSTDYDYSLPTLKNDIDDHNKAEKDNAFDYIKRILIFIFIIVLLVAIPNVTEYIIGIIEDSRYRVIRKCVLYPDIPLSEVQREDRVKKKQKTKLKGIIDKVTLDQSAKKKLYNETSRENYKAVAWELLRFGVYDDCFHEILDKTISKQKLKSYADYRAFITME